MELLFLIIILSYLLGSIPSAVWVGKYFKGIDIREHGSKNAGATNTGSGGDGGGGSGNKGANGGSGVITPDLTIEESVGWIGATENSTINPIYVVAPSTKDARLAQVTSKCGGFVYAASLMGVTGARASVSSGAADLVARVRKTTDLPIAVGLGVSTREQAKGVAAYADGVIVGSAFIKVMQDAPSEEEGLKAVTELARELAKGVREGR